MIWKNKVQLSRVNLNLSHLNHSEVNILISRFISNERGILLEYRVFGCLILFLIIFAIAFIISYFTGESIGDAIAGTGGILIFILIIAIIIGQIANLYQFLKRLWLKLKMRKKSEVERFYSAVKNEDINIVKSISKKMPDLVNAKDEQGATPLHYAAKYVKKQMIELLISRDADVNAKDITGETPLHYVICTTLKNKKEVVKFLISKGADPNTKDHRGQTILMSAIKYGSDDLVKMLLAEGVDVNEKNHAGETALSLAENKRRHDIVQLLKDAGVT